MLGEMKYGRLNILLGALGVAIFGLGGFVLGAIFNNNFQNGVYAIDLVKAIIKAEHTHGMPLSFYNLIFGLLIDRLALSDKLKKSGFIIAVFSLIMPLGLILRDITDGALMFAPVAMAGGACLVGFGDHSFYRKQNKPGVIFGSLLHRCKNPKRLHFHPNQD